MSEHAGEPNLDSSERRRRNRLDLISEPSPQAQSRPTTRDGQPDPPNDQRVAGDATRPFVGVQFDCCGTYARIYRNASETAYVGNCPRCARKIEIKIVPGGSSSRFFTAN